MRDAQLQGLVTLSATIAIQNACCVSVLMRVLQEAALAHEIVESQGVQGRVVLDVDAECWE